MCLSIEFVPKARQAGFPNLVQPLNVHGAIYLWILSLAYLPWSSG